MSVRSLVSQPLRLQKNSLCVQKVLSFCCFRRSLWTFSSSFGCPKIRRKFGFFLRGSRPSRSPPPGRGSDRSSGNWPIPSAAPGPKGFAVPSRSVGDRPVPLAAVRSPPGRRGSLGRDPLEKTRISYTDFVELSTLQRPLFVVF